jgi:hypothetical protein
MPLPWLFHAYVGPIVYDASGVPVPCGVVTSGDRCWSKDESLSQSSSTTTPCVVGCAARKLSTLPFSMAAEITTAAGCLRPCGDEIQKRTFEPINNVWTPPMTMEESKPYMSTSPGTLGYLWQFSIV